MTSPSLTDMPTPQAALGDLPIPPGPRGPRRFRFQANLIKDTMQPMVDMSLEWGEVSSMRTRGRDLVIVAGHEQAKQVLITDQDNYEKGAEYDLLRILLGDGLLTNGGDPWRHQRTLVQPMFAKRYLKNFTAHMTGATADALENGPLADTPDGETLDVAEAMMALTLDVVGRALFGADLSGETARRVGPAMSDALHLGTRMARRPSTFLATKLPGYDLEKAMKLNPESRRFERSLDELRAVIDDLLDEREKNGEPGEDLLGLMLSARDEETGEGMSRKQIGYELMTFMLAGHETTANALAWTWRNLSLNPAAREQLFEEVDTVLGDRIPTMDDVDLLPWTKACVEESMRLNPPVWAVGRRPFEDARVGDFRVPKNSAVFVLIAMIHRDPKIWENPEGFDPRRFLPENSKDRPRHAYLPFGAGRRVCVGQTFAMVEAVLLTAMIARKLAFDLPRGSKVRPEAAITLRPKGGLPMNMIRRSVEPALPGVDDAGIEPEEARCPVPH